MCRLKSVDWLKSKSFIVFVTIFGMLGIVGCKPKTTTISGQAFIVTQSGENIKFGDIQVLLIEKSQGAEFLQRKQASVESVTASRQQEMLDAKRVVEKSQADYTSFVAIRQSRPDLDDPPKQSSGSLPDSGVLRFTKYALNDYSVFLKNNFYGTNASCIKLKSEIDPLWRQQQASAKIIDSVEAQLQSALHQGLIDERTVNALSRRDDALRADWNYKTEQIDSLLSDLETTLDNKINEQKAITDAAELRLDTAKAVLENSPTAEDYLNDFTPVFFQKTISDADGKFSFAYPHDKSLAIYATAQRMILNRTEKYYWLVDAPANVEAAQVFLSNRNLVSVDPDNYFSRKPK